jgi:hypothetical protein
MVKIIDSADETTVIVPPDATAADVVAAFKAARSQWAGQVNVGTSAAPPCNSDDATERRRDIAQILSLLD